MIQAMGRAGKLPHPTPNVEQDIPAPIMGKPNRGLRRMVTIMAQVRESLSCSATGGPAKLPRDLAALLHRYQPDEVMVTSMIHDPAARIRSIEIAAEVLSALRSAAQAA